MDANYYNTLCLNENTNIKVAFLDFDDTLCIHLNKQRNKDEWFKAQVNQDLNYYLNEKKYRPMIGMNYLIHKLEDLKIPTFGLTCTEYSTVESLKLNFVHHYYGNYIQKMICTATKEFKIKFIENYCNLKNIRLDNVLLVDDNSITIHLAMDAGINIRTPQEICACYGRQEIEYFMSPC